MNNSALINYIQNINYLDNILIPEYLKINLIDYFSLDYNQHYFSDSTVIGVVFYGLEYASGVLFLHFIKSDIILCYHIIMEYININYQHLWYYKHYVLLNFISNIIFNNIQDKENILYLFNKYNYIGCDPVYGRMSYENYKSSIKTHIHNKHFSFEITNIDLFNFRTKFFMYDLFMVSDKYFNNNT
jgi:hypothetical protein